MAKSQDVKYEVVGQEEPTLAPAGKKRGRRPNAQALEGKTEQEVAEIESGMALDRHLEDVDAKFGNGEPYKRERVEFEVGQYLRRSAIEYLEAGNRLIQLKEHEGHGNFLPCLARIGIGEDVAQKMMLTARKLQGTELANTARSGILLPSKLYEIALLDEDQIDDLDEGGAVGSLTLDDIQRMTAREVRAALREERKKHDDDIQARERVIEEKNEKINQLDRELRGLPPKSQKEVNAALLLEARQRFTGYAMDICALMVELRKTMDEALRLPEVDALTLAPFQDEIVRLGTENIAAEWEGVCAVLEDFRPIRGEGDVPALG